VVMVTKGSREVLGVQLETQAEYGIIVTSISPLAGIVTGT